MALHGTFSVNAQIIGTWEATRTSHVSVDPQPNDQVEYHWRVVIKRNPEEYDGDLPVLSTGGSLTHRFGDGALALAALVIKAGHGSLASELVAQ